MSHALAGLEERLQCTIGFNVPTYQAISNTAETFRNTVDATWAAVGDLEAFLAGADDGPAPVLDAGGKISLWSVPWIEALFTFYKIYASRRGVSELTAEQRDHVQVPLDGVAADLAAPSLVGVVQAYDRILHTQGLDLRGGHGVEVQRAEAIPLVRLGQRQLRPTFAAARVLTCPLLY